MQGGDLPERPYNLLHYVTGFVLEVVVTGLMYYLLSVDCGDEQVQYGGAGYQDKRGEQGADQRQHLCHWAHGGREPALEGV